MHWLEAQRDEATHPKLRGLQRSHVGCCLVCCGEGTRFKWYRNTTLGGRRVQPPLSSCWDEVPGGAGSGRAPRPVLALLPGNLMQAFIFLISPGAVGVGGRSDSPDTLAASHMS